MDTQGSHILDECFRELEERLIKVYVLQIKGFSKPNIYTTLETAQIAASQRPLGVREWKFDGVVHKGFVGSEGLIGNRDEHTYKIWCCIVDL